jgi:hypothetical protein
MFSHHYRSFSSSSSLHHRNPKLKEKKSKTKENEKEEKSTRQGKDQTLDEIDNPLEIINDFENDK